MKNKSCIQFKIVLYNAKSENSTSANSTSFSTFTRVSNKVLSIFNFRFISDFSLLIYIYKYMNFCTSLQFLLSLENIGLGMAAALLAKILAYHLASILSLALGFKGL